jgi:hypothetical protein
MLAENSISLESALAKLQSDAEIAVKAGNSALSQLKKLQNSAKNGNLRELRKALDDTKQAILDLDTKFQDAQKNWNFDEEQYFSNNRYLKEILAIAKQSGLNIFEQDDRLYCYPFLLRLLPNESCVQIDKTREKRIRPTVLINHLKNLQDKPVKFKAEVFLESLWNCYEVLVKTRGKERLRTGIVIMLKEIHRHLTLLPGTAKEYSRQEFGRDIYLLDLGEVRTTRKGWTINLHTDSGRDSSSRVITVVTKSGDVKRYHGISFSK